jgi:hypothetical protein
MKGDVIMESAVSILLMILIVFAVCAYVELREIRKLLQGGDAGARALLRDVLKQLETMTQTMWGANDDRRDIKAIQREMLAIQEKRSTPSSPTAP